jgi:hypothetical protein
MIDLSHMISILIFLPFCSAWWDEQNKISLAYVLKNFEIKNHLNQISNFQQPKNHSLYLFRFSFSVLARQYFFSYLSSLSYTLSYIFSLDQSTVRSNRAFCPPTQFPLVIFVIQTLAATFSLPAHRAALRRVIRLRHRGAASPPPPLPLRKWPHPIASLSPLLSPVTGAIEVPLPLPPSPWLPTLCHTTTL